MPVPALRIVLVALAATLLAAAPAAAGALAEVDGAVLRYTADDVEPVNVTIDRVGGVLTLEENGSRMTAGAGCAVSEDRYEAECAADGVERIEVRLGVLGSDVRIRADLPADDAIDGGGGQDILGGGAGADELTGGDGDDLVTYSDRIGRGGALLGRRGGVRIALGRVAWSGARDEGDTIHRDIEQVEGGSGNDRFALRDGLASGVACGKGRDTIVTDPRDAIEIDCENGRVAPPRGGGRMTIPTLPFPFAKLRDRGRGTIAVEPLLPLRRGTILLRVSCPAGLGLLELVDAPGCRGRVRFSRSGAEMATRRVYVPRGGTITIRLPLSGSRALARRAAGLTVTATALPDRGDVIRHLRFRVRG